VHQQLDGPIVLVWDNLNIHASRAMRELIATRSWPTAYQLPPYAYPVAGICRFLQTVYCQGLRYDVMCTVC